DLALGEQISDVLAAGLEGNPRQVKRFLNALLLRMQMAEARGIELRKRVLAKVMVLEYLKPVRFEQLAQWQAEQEGEPVEVAALEASVRDDAAVTAGEGEGPEVVEAGRVSDGDDKAGMTAKRSEEDGTSDGAAPVGGG